MQFGILGPLEVVADDGDPLHIGSPKQQALLALLLIHANTVLSVDRIIDELWPTEAPSGGARTLRFHVSKLRTALRPANPIETVKPGYRLAVPPEWIDALRFESLVDAAATHRLERPDRAAALLAEALDLWRGPPLAGFEYDRFAEAAIRRLEEERLRAVEDQIEARLALGDHREVLPELERLIAEHPWRERLRAHQMRALVAADRRADALRAYRAAVAYFGEEMGIEPGARLRELEERILLEDETVLVADRRRGHAAHNLPADIDRFVGREVELKEVTKLVAGNRLTTLLGIGGIGKTRLAGAAARQLTASFADGAWLVDVGPIHGEELLWAATLHALGLVEAPGSSPRDQTLDHLEPRHALLLFDNCEHARSDAGAVVRRMLQDCPEVSVMLTSRVALGWPSEVTYLVPPMTVPGDRDGEPGSDAAALLVERAGGLAPHQQLAPHLVDELVTRLEGIPLAIELAAARLQVYSLTELLDRLADRFSALDRAGLEAGRHATLRATLDWSHGLLEPTHRRLLDALSVFHGSFTRDSAETICGGSDVAPESVADSLQALVASSLVVPLGGDPARFRMLDTVREYGAERLAEWDDAGLMQRRHRDVYISRAEETRWRLLGPERAGWLDETERERPNFVAAFRHSLELGDVQEAQRLVSGLGQFWGERAHLSEGSACAAALLGRLDSKPSAVRCETLNVASWLAMWSGDFDGADQLAQEQRLQSADLDDPLLQAGAFNNLGNLNGFARGRPTVAAPFFMQALELLDDADQIRTFPPLMGLAYMQVLMGDFGAAASTCDRVEELASDLGYVFGDAAVAQTRAWADFYQGRLSRAERELRAATEALTSLGIRMFEAASAYALASVLVEMGDLERAQPLARTALDLVRETAGRWRTAEVQALLGRLHTRAGRTDDALAWLRRALTTCQTTGQRDAAMYALAGTAEIAAARGDSAAAAWLDGAVDRLRSDEGLALPAPFRERADERRAETVDGGGGTSLADRYAAGSGAGFGAALSGAIERMEHL